MSILNGLENLGGSYSAISNYPRRFVKDYNTNFWDILQTSTDTDTDAEADGNCAKKQVSPDLY